MIQLHSRAILVGVGLVAGMLVGSLSNAESDQPERIPSPDGNGYAVVHRFGFHLPPGTWYDDEEKINPYGHLFIVSETNSVGVPWVRESRGVQFEFNLFDVYSGPLVPCHLQWDSKGRYLYYEFGGGACASEVWQVDPKDGVPRYVSATRETFYLSPQPDGPDWVVCNHVRDGKWLWFAYTPEDIAQDTHTFSTNQVFAVENQVVAGLKKRLAEDDLYPWATEGQLVFFPWKTNNTHVFVQISEIHRGDDGADPKTQPTVAFWRMDRQAGGWEVEWPAPGEGWITYEAYWNLRTTGDGAAVSEKTATPDATQPLGP